MPSFCVKLRCLAPLFAELGVRTAASAIVEASYSRDMAILRLQAAQYCHQNGVILAVRGVGAAGDDDRAGCAADGAGHGLPCNVGAGLV